MPRPIIPRIVSEFPTAPAFVPQGLPPNGEVNLTIEALEALRLVDFEGHDQEAAAQLMGVSRHTVGRVLTQARMVVAEALVTAKVIRIGGGTYQTRGRRHRGRWCRKGQRCG
jgi:predicted DNA-binding protein (UPF0251 family)